MLVEGARLGGYEVLGPLGAGGMGEVYRARDTRLGRDVDGRWLGFPQGGMLKKMLLEGGAPVAVAALPQGGSLRGASWGPDGTMVFSPGPQLGLWRVPAEGGTPRAITVPDTDKGEVSHRWPQFLPGGKHVLFAMSPASLIASDAQIGTLSLETGRFRTAVEGSGYGPPWWRSATS